MNKPELLCPAGDLERLQMALHFGADAVYLAGAQCPAQAQPPQGWTRWQVPGFEYLVFPGGGPEAFSLAMAYLRGNGLSLCGAQQDHTDPATGCNEMYFPIRRL